MLLESEKIKLVIDTVIDCSKPEVSEHSNLKHRIKTIIHFHLCNISGFVTLFSLMRIYIEDYN